MTRPAQDEFLLAARTVLAILRARSVLRRGGFPAALRRYGLAAVPADDRMRRESPAPARPSLGVAVRVLRLPLLGSTCLPTSLALADVLARADAHPDLVIGVRSDAGEFSAHAWVEIDGRRLDPARIPPDRYEEIGRFRRVDVAAS